MCERHEAQRQLVKEHQHKVKDVPLLLEVILHSINISIGIIVGIGIIIISIIVVRIIVITGDIVIIVTAIVFAIMHGTTWHSRHSAVGMATPRQRPSSMHTMQTWAFARHTLER